MTPSQLRTRERFETLIRLMSPGLNLVLSVGDRVSKLVEPEDYEYYPPRTGRVEPPPPSPELRDSGD